MKFRSSAHTRRCWIRIESPARLRELSEEQLPELAQASCANICCTALDKAVDILAQAWV
jgi:hypothetical protein